jgi:hypothetical protein
MEKRGLELRDQDDINIWKVLNKTALSIERLGEWRVIVANQILTKA